MHIPDGVLSTGTLLATGISALGGASYAFSRLEKARKEKTVVLMGTMSAFVFAAQMVNFTLFPFPISGHLIGGVLAAVMLGPWAGATVIGIVLVVQCLLAGDGGLLSLGANFLNMGLIGCLVGFVIYRTIRDAIGGRTGVLIGSMAAAWFSVILASAAFAVEFAASGHWSRLLDTLAWMALVHTGIGLGEAVITGLVVRFVLMVRPDLIFDPKPEGNETAAGWARRAAPGGLAIAAGIAVFLAPLASPYADGLEYVSEKLEIPMNAGPSVEVPAPLPDYEFKALGDSKSIATAVAGLVGTLVVFGVGALMSRVFTSKASQPESSLEDVV
ncbi:MAG: energy-coupling factor ABC transporter permease [Isosphaeraceae bacterium]|nr:energy-coupling factor ABC transporter permease [Isosphaeraceae bacterium]